MSNFDSIKGIMDGYNPHVALMEQTRKLVKKWGAIWFIGRYYRREQDTRNGVLLENQASSIN